MKGFSSGRFRKGFTLVEILITIGIIAVIYVAIVILLNPSQLFAQGQDANRVASVNTLDKSVSLYYSQTIDSPNTLFMGTSSVVYLSIPDPTATSSAGTNCSGLGLSSPSTTYHCASPSDYLKTDGTGWIPINFSTLSEGNVLTSLPVDPVNTTSSGEYFAYVTNGQHQYEIIANLASTKYAATNGGVVKAGSDTGLINSLPGGWGASTTIWVADYGNNRIEKFSPSGSYLGQLGCGGSGGCSGSSAAGSFNGPMGVTFDPNGNLWVADFNNNRVQEFNSAGTFVKQIGCAGSGGCGASTTNGFFNGPMGIAFDAGGNMWVADENNNRVQEFSPSGSYLGQLGCGGSGGCGASAQAGYFYAPYDVAVDASGTLWASDWYNDRIEAFTPAGVYLGRLGCGGNFTATSTCGDSGANGWFSSCEQGVAVDTSGDIWAADYENNRVERFTPTDAYVSQLGCSGSGGCVASSTNGYFNYPFGVTLDTSGNVWVADYYNNRVQEFSPSGSYLGQLGCGGSGGCSASSANGSLTNPTFVAIHT